MWRLAAFCSEESPPLCRPWRGGGSFPAAGEEPRLWAGVPRLPRERGRGDLPLSGRCPTPRTSRVSTRLANRGLLAEPRPISNAACQMVRTFRTRRRDRS